MAAVQGRGPTQNERFGSVGFCEILAACRLEGLYLLQCVGDGCVVVNHCQFRHPGLRTVLSRCDGFVPGTLVKNGRNVCEGLLLWKAFVRSKMVFLFGFVLGFCKATVSSCGSRAAVVSRVFPWCTHRSPAIYCQKRFKVSVARCLHLWLEFVFSTVGNVLDMLGRLDWKHRSRMWHVTTTRGSIDDSPDNKGGIVDASSGAVV